MSRFAKHFSGTTEISPKTVTSMRNNDFAARFGNVKGRKWDSFAKFVGKNEAGEYVPVTRIIFYSTQPSMHKCDARCQNAKGHNCECSCGGENHGING